MPNVYQNRNSLVVLGVLGEVYAPTTYSPRYEFVTVSLFTQIRIYRVYIDDRYSQDRLVSGATNLDGVMSGKA